MNAHELRAPAEILGELRIAALLGELGLELQRLGRDPEVVRADLTGEHALERDLGTTGRPPASHVVAAPCSASGYVMRHGGLQLDRIDRSGTRRRSIATSWTTRAWYFGPSGSLDSGSSSGSGASPFA